ncbi:hypothetical protein [Spirochaeta thermophila]|nr:hypothetical protein [Spirochaeta thermophila]
MVFARFIPTPLATEYVAGAVLLGAAQREMADYIRERDFLKTAIR